MPRILAALLVLLLATSAHAGTIWQMPTEYPATTLVGEGLALFAKLTAGKTNGEIAITPRYEAGQAFKSSGMIAAIQEGRTPAGDAFLSALTATDPLFALPALPFLATSFDDAQRLADLARPAYAKAMAKHGLRLLYLTPWPATGLWTKTRVTTPEQLRALSVRAYDATSTEVMTNAGVKATNLSFADTMPRLKDGSIDAVLSSGDGGAGRGLYQFLPNPTESLRHRRLSRDSAHGRDSRRSLEATWITTRAALAPNALPRISLTWEAFSAIPGGMGR